MPEKRNSPPYTKAFTSIAAGASESYDFSDNTNALNDLPFNYARAINNSLEDFEVTFDSETYQVPAGTIIPFKFDNRLFRIITAKNLAAVNAATITVEVSNLETANETLSEKGLKLLERLGI